MGCDIHLWVETLVDSKWHFANAFEVVENEFGSWIEWDEPYTGRNYYLFALLADVRNYSSELKPISPPRGIPPDISDIGARICDELAEDGHSYSWLSATELLDYNWSQKSPVYNDDTEHSLCSDFVDDFLPTLQQYNGDLSKVRVVFCFDN